MQETGCFSAERKTVKIWGTLGLMALAATCGYSGAPPHDLRVGEGFREPIGFHDPAPRFSWTLPAGVQKQSAYRIEAKDESVLWDSGWVESDQSVLVPKNVAQIATFIDSIIAANSCSPKYSICLPICFTLYSFKTFTQMQR